MKSRNVSLIIGLSVPVVMVAVIAASIYLPGLSAPSPSTNFLYMTGGHYYGPRYAVVRGQLTQLDTKQPDILPPTPQVPARLYVHDVKTNASAEVSFEEAQKLALDDRETSPDGYAVRHGNREGGMFPFFFYDRGYTESLYLTGHHVSRKLNLVKPPESPNYYYSRPQFVGWIRAGGADGQK